MKPCYVCLCQIRETIGNDLVFIGLASQKIRKLSGNIPVKTLAQEIADRVLKVESYFDRKIEEEKP